MTTITSSPTERYAAAFTARERTPAPGDAAWAHELRQRALARFQQLGFPTARRGNEPWKYTNVAPIAQAAFSDDGATPLAADVVGRYRKLLPWHAAWARLVFLNGKFVPSLSTTGPTATGLRLSNLAQAMATDRALLEPSLARIAPYETDAFLSLNTAFLGDGAFVYVPEGAVVQQPVHVVFLSAGMAEPIVTYPRVLLLAGPGSKVTLIESYAGASEPPYFTNAVTEIALGAGAQVTHYKVMREGAQAYHIGSTYVRHDRDSAFSSTAVSAGAALARNNLSVLLDAPGSSCRLNGLYFTGGRQHLDNNLNVDHAQPHTTSRQYYKGILDGQSRAVFGGRVVVREHAAKADAQQSDKNLLLSRGAEADTKPSLEIFTDDVKCSHGATAGQIDQDALFYLATRGLDEATTRRLLVRAFASEIIDNIPLAPLRSYLDRLFSGALASSHAEDQP